jgi:hypothetical protein
VILVAAVADEADPSVVVVVVIASRRPRAALLPLVRSILAAAVVTVLDPLLRAGIGAAPATSKSMPANKPQADSDRCECCRFISGL